MSEDNQNYNAFKNTGEKISVNQAYSHFKTEEKEWLNQCPSQILRNASATWYTAKQRFLEYKAKKYNKLVVKVSPHYLSQECAHCGHTHADNRKTQNSFLCLLCGNHDNADVNAAKTIAKRGV